MNVSPKSASGYSVRVLPSYAQTCSTVPSYPQSVNLSFLSTQKGIFAVEVKAKVFKCRLTNNQTVYRITKMRAIKMVTLIMVPLESDGVWVITEPWESVEVWVAREPWDSGGAGAVTGATILEFTTEQTCWNSELNGISERINRFPRSQT